MQASRSRPGQQVLLVNPDSTCRVTCIRGDGKYVNMCLLCWPLGCHATKTCITRNRNPLQINKSRRLCPTDLVPGLSWLICDSKRLSQSNEMRWAHTALNCASIRSPITALSLAHGRNVRGDNSSTPSLLPLGWLVMAVRGSVFYYVCVCSVLYSTSGCVGG